MGGNSVTVRSALAGAAALAIAFLATGAQAGDPLANVKSVAIISAIGDTVTLAYADEGGGFFNAVDPQRIDSTSWGIDDAVTKQIADAIRGRFTVKKVAYNLADFTRIPWSPIPNRQAPVEKQLWTLANPGVDAYFVVTKMQIADAVGQAGPNQSGLGLAREGGGMFSSDTITMYAIYTIRVIDARTFETLETEGAHLPKTGLLPRVPIVEVDDSLWPGHASDVTPAKEAAIKTKMMALVQESIGSTLHYMNLAP